MSRILKGISDKKLTVEEVKEKIRTGYSKVPMFEELAILGDQTLFDQLNKYGKFKKWTLENFLEADALDLNERNEENQTLVQIYIEKNKVGKVRLLLRYGARLKKTDLSLAEKPEIKALLKYRPGSNEISIFEFCSARHRDDDYFERIDALLLDQSETTDEESSEAESFSSDFLSDEEEDALEEFRRQKLKRYNRNPDKYFERNDLCLLAARGVHFSPKYFSQATIESVIENKDEPHPTYSQSTLFDAGYTADNEVPEDNKKIKKRHRYNLQFIENLKETKDRKEKKIGSYNPPASRNNLKFDNLCDRFMQVYINSYGTLFNRGSIKKDFGFDTTNNPLVSASWNVEKAAMYASGFRFNLMADKLRRNPHYRRFTGKAKHPNMGYLDLYMFDPAYVREWGFDRLIMCIEDKIHLSAFYRAEAEIIFPSMIPACYHYKRYVISLPSFEVSYRGNRDYFSRYGIISNNSYNKAKEEISSLPAIATAEYKDVINKITEKAAGRQATIIEKTTHCRLFRSKNPQAVAYDHGDELKPELLKMR